MNMRSLVRFAPAIAAYFIVTGVSEAETVTTTAELRSSKTALAYVFSRPMLDTMYRLGVEEDRKFGLQAECKSSYQVKPFSAAVLKPIDFPDGKQNPTKGVWLARYQLERCGDAKFYNAMFLANSDGDAPMPKAFYPGSTNAGAVLVNDALRSAVAGAVARAGLKDCKQADVFDMRVTEPAHTVVEGDKTFRGIWSEIWTFRLCGQMVDVAMKFIPDADGGGTTFVTGPIIPEGNSASGKKQP